MSSTQDLSNALAAFRSATIDPRRESDTSKTKSKKKSKSYGSHKDKTFIKHRSGTSHSFNGSRDRFRSQERASDDRVRSRSRSDSRRRIAHKVNVRSSDSDIEQKPFQRGPASSRTSRDEVPPVPIRESKTVEDLHLKQKEQAEQLRVQQKREADYREHVARTLAKDALAESLLKPRDSKFGTETGVYRSERTARMRHIELLNVFGDNPNSIRLAMQHNKPAPIPDNEKELVNVLTQCVAIMRDIATIIQGFVELEKEALYATIMTIWVTGFASAKTSRDLIEYAATNNLIALRASLTNVRASVSRYYNMLHPTYLKIRGITSNTLATSVEDEANIVNIVRKDMLQLKLSLKAEVEDPNVKMSASDMAFGSFPPMIRRALYAYDMYQTNNLWISPALALKTTARDIPGYDSTRIGFTQSVVQYDSVLKLIHQSDMRSLRLLLDTGVLTPPVVKLSKAVLEGVRYDAQRLEKLFN